jgi:hypothetical protein
MAELGLTANHSAASRRDAPDAMASTTRSRNSKEHGFGIDPPPKIESVPPDSLIQTIPGNTDSTQVKSALSFPGKHRVGMMDCHHQIPVFNFEARGHRTPFHD